ncbi:MAG: Re/Si-specific NAD(P)(+) transhydrogenase subunit alpha [Minwuia sp.]|uniref:Re/Si-specific NAD(P)(+) transhydrogenase subunit alpha n=1 Tax=Minwuia sp. TaxID=2493630 RepID=UPI003A87C03E
MKIGVPKEVHDGERRVALTPSVAQQIQKFGYSLAIESGAGEHSDFSDDAYREAGVEVLDSASAVWERSDIVMKVRAPEAHPSGVHETEMMREGQTLMSFVWPAQNPELMDQMAARKGTVISMDAVPRISRAQKLDALSSMANIAGYRAVIEAANHFGRFFTGQITAAGKVPPAKVMVIGAGVAGLAAIGAARGLGAIVRAFDTRPEVKQQVESMGAEFLELDFEEEGSGSGGYAKEMSKEFIDAEMALFREQCKDVDIVITTALIPGKPAPKLILADMVEILKPGSVVVDLAAEQGGNCELTEPGQVVVKHGVTLIGHVDLPSRLAAQSSQLYASNLRHFLDDLTPEKDGQINVNMEDTVIRGATVIKDGEITWPPPKIEVSAAPKAAPPKPKPEKDEKAEARNRGITSLAIMGLGAVAMIALGSVAPPDFMAHFTVFVLACFVGYQVIWNVTPALHTPLMAVTNAISGIIVIGALLQVSSPSWTVTVLAFVSVLIATINIAGGFLVTQRMLGMFRKD